MESRVNAPDNQHATQRILPNLRVHKFKGKVDILGLLILGPFVQIPRHKHTVVLEPSALRNHGLELGLVEVRTAGFGDSVFIVFETICVE